MTARDVLAEIEQQAAMNSKDGGTTWGLLTLARTDVPALVAALRAVLDLHEPFGSDPGICAACEDYAPCATRRAITDALGGGA